MKLLSVLALAASSLSSADAISISAAAAASDYEHARVVPGVLPADSIAKLHGQVGAIRLLRKTAGDGVNRKYGEAAVEPEDLKRILKSIDDDRHVGWTNNLRTTLITGDTVPHMDAKVGGDGEFAEDEDVMFVCLNDNEGAYFQIGEDKVPVVEGTLVTFKGNKVAHNTIVPSGTEVRLLGPIASRDLQDVGDACNDLGTDEDSCVIINAGGDSCCKWEAFGETGNVFSCFERCGAACNDTPSPTSSPTSAPTPASGSASSEDSSESSSEDSSSESSSEDSSED